MTFTASSPWKDPPFLRTVIKPSISMGHLYHGELLNNQRVNDLMIFDQILISVKYPDMIAQIGDQI
jgi:hypothetical protein